MRELRNFINGRLVAPQTNRWLDKLNPATGELIARVGQSDARDADLAVRSAHHAFRGWSECSFEERSRALNGLSDYLAPSARELAQLESMDQGKPMSLTLALDVPEALSSLKNQPSPQGAPIGVAVLMPNWSSPLQSLVSHLAVALACGNTAVVVAPELAPVTAFRLAELLAKSNLPPGLCNILFGSQLELAPMLASHPLTRLFAARVESETATQLQQLGPEKRWLVDSRPKGVALVLGGTRLTDAIDSILRCCFLNQGQAPENVSHVYVARSLVSQLESLLIEALPALPVGDPLDRRTFVGAIISEAHVRAAEGFLHQARQHEATTLWGGTRPHLRDEFARGFFLNPTILREGATRLRCDRIWAPVVVLKAFDEVDEIVPHIPPGLAISVWTDDPARAEPLRLSLAASEFWVNAWMSGEMRSPPEFWSDRF